MIGLTATTFAHGRDHHELDAGPRQTRREMNRPGLLDGAIDEREVVVLVNALAADDHAALTAADVVNGQVVPAVVGVGTGVVL